MNPRKFHPASVWPDDKVETVSVSHLIVARKALSETTVAAFFRQLFAVRQAVARQVPGAARITKPDTEKDAELPIHRGAAAVIDGTERTFLDRYGDYFWFALLLLSGDRFGRRLVASLFESGRQGGKHQPSQQNPGHGFHGAHRGIQPGTAGDAARGRRHHR